MIWYFIAIALLIIPVIVRIINNDEYSDLSEAMILPIVVSSIMLIVLLCCTVFSHCNLEAKEIELNEERSVIVYQLENKTYLNDNNLGTHEVMTEASEFNQKVLGNRKRHENPWTNWLYSPVWEEIEPIDLNDFN